MALAASLAGPGFTPLSKGADWPQASGGILTSRADFIALRRHCMSLVHAHCLASLDALDHKLNLHWAMAGDQ
jgi:hypothetical protein